MRLRDVKVDALPGYSQVICEAMRERGLLEHDPRDFLLIDGSELTTYYGTYRVKSNLDGREVDPTNVEGDGEIEADAKPKLIHRARAWTVLGPEVARRFWRFGRRTRR